MILHLYTEFSHGSKTHFKVLSGRMVWRESFPLTPSPNIEANPSIVQFVYTHSFMFTCGVDAHYSSV